MSTSKIFTRIAQKHDLEVNWLKAENFVPMQGELIIYDIEVDSDGNTLELPTGEKYGRTTPYAYERFKIGDGVKTVTELPFIVTESIQDGKGEDSLQQIGSAALGKYSFAQGFNTTANIDYSHTEGYKTETLAKAYRIKSVNTAKETLEDNTEKITGCTITFNDDVTLVDDGITDGMLISLLAFIDSLSQGYKFLAKISKVIDNTTIALDIAHGQTKTAIKYNVPGKCTDND